MGCAKWKACLQIANNYEKDVFNGDQGFVRSISSDSPSSMTVAFPPAAGAAEEGDERLVHYRGREVDELDLAWATTVHKAQGGEAKGVLLALAAAQRPLLSRRLLYTGWLLSSAKHVHTAVLLSTGMRCLYIASTGLTRAKELLVVVSPPGPLSTAVAQTKDSMRQHCLERRFRSAAQAAGIPQQPAHVFQGGLHDIALTPSQTDAAAARAGQERRVWA